MSINMLNILENLEVSEECLKDIMEMVSKEVQSMIAQGVLDSRKQKVEDKKKEIMNAKNSEERNIAIRGLGRAQERVRHAESKIEKAQPQPSKIIFGPSSYS